MVEQKRDITTEDMYSKLEPFSSYHAFLVSLSLKFYSTPRGHIGPKSKKKMRKLIFNRLKLSIVQSIPLKLETPGSIQHDGFA